MAFSDLQLAGKKSYENFKRGRRDGGEKENRLLRTQILFQKSLDDFDYRLAGIEKKD